MSEYVLQKKTKCEFCAKGGEYQTVEHALTCRNGYIYEEVSLKDALDAYWRSDKAEKSGSTPTWKDFERYVNS